MANFSPYSLIHPFLLLGVLCLVQSPPEQEEIHNLKQNQGVPIKKQHRILGFFPKINQTGEWARLKLATTEVNLLHLINIKKWQLIFWSFGSYLPKTKRQKYEMNETLESLLPYIIKRQIIYYHLSFWILSDFLSLRRFCLRIFWIFFLSILPRILCIPIPLKVS